MKNSYPNILKYEGLPPCFSDAAGQIFSINLLSTFSEAVLSYYWRILILWHYLMSQIQ